VIAGLLVVVLVFYGIHRLRRRNKRRMVAGLDSARPGFFLEPPRRSVGSRKDELL
jgi:hypothetical protein